LSQGGFVSGDIILLSTFASEQSSASLPAAAQQPAGVISSLAGARGKYPAFSLMKIHHHDSTVSGIGGKPAATRFRLWYNSFKGAGSTPKKADKP
jgi:hypothetical protein